MNERSQRLSRRKFLLSVGAGGAATAAAVVATKKSTTSSSASGKGKRATVGYHATEHVNNYYRTTKV
jgi:shikimate 5-dehydrogenase